MSPKIDSASRTAPSSAGASSAEASSGATMPDGSPPLPADGGWAGLGIEALAAMLVVDSANKMRDLANKLESQSKQAEVDALRQQVDALHDKASDVRGEGMLAGALLIGGGAATIGAAYATATTTNNGAMAKELRESSAQCLQQAEPSTMPLAKSWSELANHTADHLDLSAAMGPALNGTGQMMNVLAPNLAKATYGAAQVNDDANATKHAADAKFAENAKDEYANLAKDARATIDKAQQALQSFVQERTAAQRAILKI